MTAKPQRNEHGRRGVALIIVLGFLSIMILLAVAFLTQARVERLVAGSSLEAVRTRQMAQTALAAAMQDYLNALKSTTQADTKHNIFLSGDGLSTLSFYFSGETLDDDRLLIGKAANWLLQEQLDAATSGGNDDIRNAEWIWVREKPGVRTNILGRYAYACFDMSGLIDANLLGTAYPESVPTEYEYGNATNRDNVRKMVYDALYKQTAGTNHLQLRVHQQRWRGFDTPAALLQLTDGDWNDGRNKGANRWLGTDMDEGKKIDPSSLSSYSYSVLHRTDGSGNRKKMCTSANIQSDPDYDGILAGASQPDVIKAIQDYESSEIAPQGVDYPSVKNVPMFNEITAQLEVEEGAAYVDPVTGSNAAPYFLIVRLKPEFWYPFPSKDDDLGSTQFIMPVPSVGCGGALTGPEDIWVRAAAGTAGAATLGISKAAAPAVTITPSEGLQVTAKPGLPYLADNGSGVLEYRIPLETTGGHPLPPGMYIHVRLVSAKNMTLTYLGKAVDAMPTKPLGIDFAAILSKGQKTDWATTSSYEATDPRLNHDFNSWKPLLNENTIGKTNQATEAAMGKVSGLVPGSYLYCRNGPIRFPGELGYFSAGQPWETLDIFNEAGIRLMNRMICEQPVYDLLQKHDAFFTNGTINPYTRHTNVLNAAFFGLDIREVPGVAGDPEGEERLTGTTLLKDLVTEVMKETTKNGYAGWAAILENKNLLADLNKNNRIALLNNTWGLFNESDRLFVVVVVAQSIKEGESKTGVGNWDPAEDMITGERRAVALCWMDGSAEGSADTLAQELNIIAFQYLND